METATLFLPEKNRMLKKISYFARQALGVRPDGLLKEGTKAPDFRAEDQEGHTRTSADFLGKKLVLWVYRKASTPG